MSTTADAAAAATVAGYPTDMTPVGAVTTSGAAVAHQQPSDLADVLERVLTTGIVIAGEIRVDLLDIELLTIKLRLVITSLDRAEEVGLDWWRNDSWFCAEPVDGGESRSTRSLPRTSRNEIDDLTELAEGGRDDEVLRDC